MIEKLNINQKDVWIKIDAINMHRDNPDIIPTEYFTATYYLKEPYEDVTNGKVVKDEKDQPKLFESPVAALSFAEKELERIL